MPVCDVEVSMICCSVIVYSLIYTNTGGRSIDPFTLRLFPNPNSSSGILEVYLYGAWGTVCRSGFDQAAANVACRELGFPRGGLVLSSSITFGSGTGPVWLDSVGCHGNEQTLSACMVEIGGGTSSCTHAEDVNIVCGKQNVYTYVPRIHN